MKKQFLARQGDVLLTPVTSIPAVAAIRPLDHGRVILAYGEVTGHAHQIDVPANAALLDMPNPRSKSDIDKTLTFLRVDRLSQLVHEEHSAVTLEPGLYQVIHQREYAPEAIRNVAD